MTVIEQAEHLRSYIEKAMQFLPDTDALQVKTLYPMWSKLINIGKVDTNGEPGFRFQYDGDGELYKCINGDPEFRESWIPGIHTSAIYVRIDAANAGSKEHPIPADRGMEYVYGLYYLDPEDGNVYLCKRNGEADGGTVVLTYLPHELIGHYFVAAS